MADDVADLMLSLERSNRQFFFISAVVVVLAVVTIILALLMRTATAPKPANPTPPAATNSVQQPVFTGSQKSGEQPGT